MRPQAPWTPWRVVLGFGFISMAGDMVYEAARALTGPLLFQLGASAALVGLVVGVGEALALVLRIFFGPAVDRSGKYWNWVFIGYALTAIAVPLLALPALSQRYATEAREHTIFSLALVVAIGLLWLERLGKAIRSPAKGVLLAAVPADPRAQAQGLGIGRAFGVHKALDQVGAFAGPLLTTVLITTVSLSAAYLVLALPGVLAVSLVLLVRYRSGWSLEPDREPGAGQAGEATEIGRAHV